MSWFHKKPKVPEHDFEVGERVRYPWMLNNGAHVYSTGVILYFAGTRAKIKDDFDLGFADMVHIPIENLLHIDDGNDILKGML